MSLEISYGGNVCSFYTYEIVAKTSTGATRVLQPERTFEKRAFHI